MSPTENSRSAARSRVGRLAALAVAASVCAVVPVALAPAATAADPVEIQLLNINDFHGRIDANTTKFATTIEQLKAAEENTLFLGNGDSIGATVFNSAIQQDEPTLDVLNALGLQASAVGNHEFDQGFADLSGRVSESADFPYLGANVYEKGTTTPALQEYTTFDVAGLTVGVVGAVTLETPTIVSPAGVSTIDFGDPVEAVNRVAAQLSDGDATNGEADIIVAEFHEGAAVGEATSTLEAEVAKAGAFAEIVTETSAAVDVIFTGHSHQKYAWEAPVPGVAGKTRPVLQTGQYGENIGKVVLTVDSETGDVVSHTQTNVARVATEDLSFPAVAEVKAITDAAIAEAAVIGNQPVAEITADITRAYSAPGATDRSAESTLGGLVGNALRDGLPDEFGVADLGIVNPGGLRDDLLFAGNTSSNPANTDGVVTYAEANNVLPFVNNIWLVDITGADLMGVLEQQFPSAARTTTLQLGVSDNVNITTDPAAPEGERVTGAWIDGVAVDPTETYTVSTFNFLATGGDSFTSFQAGTARDTGLVDRDLWIGYLQDSLEGEAIAPDFAKRQVEVPGLPATVTPGEEVSLDLAKLDMTSLGSPTNTEIAPLLVEGEDVYEISDGTFPVAGGAATVDFVVPDDAVDGGEIYLVASPTDTVVGPILVDAPEVEPQPTTVVPPAPVSAFYGQYVPVPVAVTSTSGVPATGVVEMFWNNQVIHRAGVVNGRASLALPKNFAPNTYRVGIRYLGDANNAPSTSGVVITQNKARSVVLAEVAPQPLKPGATGTLYIRVGNSSGSAYNGPAYVSYGGRAYTATVRNGAARVTLAPGVVGWHRLTVWQPGTGTIAASATSLSVAIRR